MSKPKDERRAAQRRAAQRDAIKRPRCPVCKNLIARQDMDTYKSHAIHQTCKEHVVAVEKEQETQETAQRVREGGLVLPGRDGWA